ncbi:sigma 54-interacting transcriptional regulator [Polyangium sp. 6x1]|uniref:sigma 54-interacting transcriptional regulator n=1 Tax=Polyangium sp. 6x1 TaxID=3042689 RepID=UPI002482A34C|nr:sigma 54-interacting transcriptional regulator [Polyangium sp. 6x1]MDI1445321.1 sigma 54-interacting transcriptional regulator [Polyangium sp. 6x1]
MKNERARDATVEIGGGDAALGAAWIRVDDGGDERALRLGPGEEIVLGSGEGVDVRLVDRTVSARHAALVHRGSVIEAVDLGSRNGMRVAGTRVARAFLSTGSAVELGRAVVRVEGSTIASEPHRGALLSHLVGRSAPMRRLGGEVRRLAPLKLPVMLRGESGTGKDLVARALHDESLRKDRPFVALNAATISRELAESELFGHQRGAFTGALRDRRGAFREAHQGTLFLDEIAALPLDVQAKLLRVVEGGIVRPLGSETAVPVDVRLVVATCEPLEQMVAARRFRADLYERLAVCFVRVPSLRERTEDIAALCTHLFATSEIGPRELSPGALVVLRASSWPGNVRELRNVIVQAAVRAPGVIQAEHVTSVLAERSGRRVKLRPDDARRIFEETGGNASEAARRASVPRSTMRDLLRAAGATGRSSQNVPTTPSP